MEAKVSRRQLLQMAGITFGATALAACSPATTGSETQDAPSDGAAEPMTLSVWDGSDSRNTNLWPKWFPRYQEEHEDIQLELVPTSDLRTKLVTAIPAGEGPDLFHIHGDWQEALVWSGQTAALPEDLFPPAELEDRFQGIQATAGPDGKYFWIPTGIMSAGLYYNVEMFEEAGIAPEDVPTTHQGVMDLAQELTVKSSDGLIDRAGFNANDWMQYMFRSMYYQQGCWLYNEDYSRALYDTDENERILSFMTDIYNTFQVTSRDFLPWQESFGTGKAAMVWSTAWISGALQVNYPELEWGILPEPTWTGERTPAAGGGAYDPQSLAVPATNSPDRISAAFDVIAWLYLNNDFLIDLIEITGTAPNVAEISDHPRLQSNPTVRALSQQLPYEVIEFGGPDEIELLRETHIIDGVFAQELSINEALRQAQAEADRVMLRSSSQITERSSYPYPDRMHFPETRT